MTVLSQGFRLLNQVSCMMKTGENERCLKIYMTYLAFGAALAVLFVEALLWIYYAFAFPLELLRYPFRMPGYALKYDIAWGR